MIPVLITLKDNLKLKHVDSLKKLSYKYIHVICKTCSVKPEVLDHHKIITHEYLSRNEIPKIIDRIYEEKSKTSLILPYFRGDSNSKFAIKCYNKTYGTKINPKLFKEKNIMNEFLGDIVKKNNIRLTFEQLMNMDFKELQTKLDALEFIVKPTNAASSRLTFKIRSQEDLEIYRTKATKKYSYIIEEYLQGDLFATDFFCDGKKLYLLCHTKETSFSELIPYLCDEYKEDYSKHLNGDYLHFLPLRYTLPIKKISKDEFKFFNKLQKKLDKIDYRGFIHLEYKFDKEKNTIGFIEWGGRLGGFRHEYMSQLYNFDIRQVTLNILRNKTTNFAEMNRIMVVNKENATNVIGIKTNVIEKTNVIKIIKKNPKFLYQSYSDFIEEIFKKNWKIKIKNARFILKSDDTLDIHPHNKEKGSLYYDFELDDKSMKQFLKKQNRIVEKLIFHDY